MAEKENREAAIEEGKNLEQVLGSVLSKKESAEAIDADSSSLFVSRTKEWFSNKYEEVSAGAKNKYERAKAWRAKEITWSKRGQELAAINVIKGSARFTRDVIGITPSIIIKILRGLGQFAKAAIMKKGNVGFGEGYKIGAEMFSFDDKKQKN